MSVARITANPKFLVLVRKLKLPAPYVRGLLDTMWDTCHANSSEVIGTAEEVEAAAQWPGEEGVFFSAVKDRWLDRVPGTDKWAAHNYWDHCPDFVYERMKKRKQRARKYADRCPGTVPGQSGDSPLFVTPPAPAPAPAPALKETPSIPRKRGRGTGGVPSLDEAKVYAKEASLVMDVEAWWDYWESVAWKRKGGVQVADWKATMRTGARLRRDTPQQSNLYEHAQRFK